MTCVEGEDLFDMREIVREKAMATIKEWKIEVHAALQGRSSDPCATRNSQDKKASRIF